MSMQFTLQRLLGRKEDHLTAMFALSLELDHEFAGACSGLLLAGLKPSADGITPRIASVEVQRCFGGKTPDIVLTLTDGRLVAVENKLDAPETMGNEIGCGEPTSNKKAPQLSRYLEIRQLEAVAFIRARRKSLSPEVLSHRRYLRPGNGAEHYLWRDFLPLMTDSGHPVTTWLREAFRVNGFVPPDATIGDLDDPERQRNFRQLWEATAELARNLGWIVQADSVKGQWFGSSTAAADAVWANPTTAEFQLRLRPRDPSRLADLRSRIKQALDALPAQGARLEDTRVRQKVGQRTVIDIFLPLEALVGSASSAEDISNRLRNFVGTVLRAL